jgi:hypothetical protein
MWNIRRCVWCAVVLLAASTALAFGPGAKQSKPLPVVLGMGPADAGNQLVPLKYTRPDTSGLEVTIDKPRSDLEFLLDKP